MATILFIESLLFVQDLQRTNAGLLCTLFSSVFFFFDFFLFFFEIF